MNTHSEMPQPPDHLIDEGLSPAANFETGLPSEIAQRNDGPTGPDCQASDGLRLVKFADQAPEPLNPEDLTAFALQEEPGPGVATKILTTVPVKKPPKDAFVRTHPDPAMSMPFSLIDRREEGQVFLLSPQIAARLQEMGETTMYRAFLALATDRRGNAFLWPLKISDRDNPWHLSARRAAEIAKDKWVRIQANMDGGCYDTFVAENQTAEPVWPIESYSRLLEIAFNGRVVREMDHPLICELRGRF